jgi:rhamnulokinase
VSQFTGLGRVGVIAPPSHDTASAVAAVPTSHPEEGSWAYISSGTWSLMGLEVKRAQLSRRVLELNLTNEGGVDGTYRLLKNISGLWLVQQCKRAFEAKGEKIDYDGLVRLARGAPMLRSLINPDDARFLNPTNMPKAMQEFCRETGQPVPRSKGELVRCALESLAMKYQTVLASLEEVSGRRVEVIHIVGGGSRNALLNQLAADACQRPVLAGPVEATVLGNVLMQARAASEIGSLAELRAVVRKSTELNAFEPRPGKGEQWKEARENFAELGKA